MHLKSIICEGMMALAKLNFTIRGIGPKEIDTVADLLSTGYYHDKW